jgi:hypothetical protein
LPVTHGFGTGNGLFAMIVNGFGAWMAVIIAVATGLAETSRAARAFVYVVTAGAAYSAVEIATDGLLQHPYRTDGYSLTTTVASGVRALRSIKLRSDVAAQFTLLRTALERYIEPKGRAMMGFDEMSGILLALDGRPIGEAWASASDHERTAAGLRASCRGGQPWWSSRWPLLLFNRGVTNTEIAALRDCGIDFAKDYRLLAPPAQTIGLSVFVPVKE